MSASSAGRPTRRHLLKALPLAAALVVSACTSSPPSDGGGSVTRISGPMPAVTGRALEGGTVSSSSYAGRPLVVNFWATWCGPCRREQPVLSAAERSAGSDGPVFIGVNYRDDPAAARAYVREFRVAYPSLEDPSGTLAYRFDVPYLPATIFIDADGQMRFRAVGALDRARLNLLISEISRPA